MKRAPLKRKTPLRPKGAVKPKRDPWIPLKKKVDLSRMDCCPQARARAEFLVSLPCSACGERGTRRRPQDEMPRPDDMVVHHIRNGQGMKERAPWWETLGLHHRCHAAEFGFSIHGGRKPAFMAAYGTEREILERINAKLPPDLCRPAPGQV